MNSRQGWILGAFRLRFATTLTSILSINHPHKFDRYYTRYEVWCQVNFFATKAVRHEEESHRGLGAALLRSAATKIGEKHCFLV